MSAEASVKIWFELDSSEWHCHGSETLWASPIVASESRLFQIANSPFFVRGISYLDIVQATKTKNDQILDFVEVVQRGGHSTYMLLMQRRNSYWSMLKTMGCSYESMHVDLSMGRRLLFSVDVPPLAHVHEVYEILERGERDGVWVFQEGYVHLSKPQQLS